MSSEVKLRNTKISDLDFVLKVEHSEENRPFICQWEEGQHKEILNSEHNSHFIIEDLTNNKLGYIILYDLRTISHGYYIKRIALSTKSKGIGRNALTLLIELLGLKGNLKLAVLEDNIRAIKSYKSVGFTFKTLSEEEREIFKSKVDNISNDCLVMEY